MFVSLVNSVCTRVNVYR